MSLSDYQNGGAQSKANSAAYAAKSTDKAAVKTGDVPSAVNPTFKARGVAQTFNSKNQYEIANFSYRFNVC